MKSIFLKAEPSILFLIWCVPPSAARSRVLLSLDPAASPCLSGCSSNLLVLAQVCGSRDDIRADDRGGSLRRALLSCHCGPTQPESAPEIVKLARIHPPAISTSPCLLPPGQFLLEQARLGEAAEMAERAAELESSEFDVVFSAAHMLRWVKAHRKASTSLKRLM